VPALRVLVDFGVDFVVVGGLAGIGHGSQYPTSDLDIAYDRAPENLQRLVDALQELGARLRGAPADVPFLLDAERLRAGANFTFITSFGPLDILGDPAGAPPYDQLRHEAGEMDFGGLVVPVASLDHLIRMKEAAGSTKDKLMASEYRALSDELRRRRSS
jgi:hypothetical protein